MDLLLKVDDTIGSLSRGHYAHICVEEDLTKPLVSKFKLCRQIRRIKYEGIHLICFECGRYGHRIETCPDAPKVHSESYDPVHASAIDSDQFLMRIQGISSLS